MPPWVTKPQGPLAAPGLYSAQLYAVLNGEASPLAEAQSFNVIPVRSSKNGTDYAEVAKYQKDTADLMRKVNNAGQELNRSKELLRHMQAAAIAASDAQASLFPRLDEMGAALSKLSTQLSGDRIRAGLNETSSPSIGGRAYIAANTWHTTQSATATQRSEFEIANTDFALFLDDLNTALNDLAQLETELSVSGAPSWR